MRGGRADGAGSLAAAGNGGGRSPAVDAVNVVLHDGHFTSRPSNSSGTRNCREHWGQVAVVAMLLTPKSTEASTASQTHRTEHHAIEQADHNHENAGNHAANTPSLGEAFALTVHPAHPHLGQIIVAHHPSERAEKATDDEAEDAEGQDERATVRLEIATDEIAP